MNPRDETVALHATAALTAVSGALVVFEEGEGAAPLAHGHRASASVQACQNTTCFEHGREQPARTRLVNRYFPTLRLAPLEAFVWERF